MKRFLILALALLMATAAHAAMDFEDVGDGLAAESFWNGSDGSGGFTSNGMHFNNGYVQEWNYWGGFAYSNRTDTQTPGWENQYSAIPGMGAAGSATYAVCYSDMPIPTVTLPTEQVLPGVYITNTTYAYWTMKNGNGFAKKFGGEDGTDPDWFSLTICGWSEGSDISKTVTIYLADFRSNDPVQDYIVKDWTWVDLSSLGAVKSLWFILRSSDMGDFGMNTPAYFAMDDSGMGMDMAASTNVTGMMGMRSLSTAGLPAPPVLMPYGLVSFTLEVSQPGATATVKFRMSQPMMGMMGWYKYDDTDGWYDFSDHAVFHQDGTVTLTLKDGGFGDADGQADGFIVDPGGPGIAGSTITMDTGGGGSGCFVGALAPSRSTAGGWISRTWARMFP